MINRFFCLLFLSILVFTSCQSNSTAKEYSFTELMAFTIWQISEVEYNVNADSAKLRHLEDIALSTTYEFFGDDELEINSMYDQQTVGIWSLDTNQQLSIDTYLPKDPSVQYLAKYNVIELTKDKMIWKEEVKNVGSAIYTLICVQRLNDLDEE